MSGSEYFLYEGWEFVLLLEGGQVELLVGLGRVHFFCFFVTTQVSVKLELIKCLFFWCALQFLSDHVLVITGIEHQFMLLGPQLVSDGR